MGIVEFFGSAAFGGITGLLGGMVNRVADYFTTKQRHLHDEKMLDKNTEYLRIETERDVLIAKETANTVREQAGYEAMGQSYDADKATYFSSTMIDGSHPVIKGIAAVMMAIVDFIRGITRPGLTLYLCILTTIMYVEQKSILQSLGAVTDPAIAQTITKDLVHAVIYLTTMAVGWWFATRSKPTA